MSNPLIRSEEHFVLLEPEKREKIVTKEEAIAWLKNWLLKINLATSHAHSIENREPIEDLLINSCELEIEPGYIIKWFAVRVSPD